MQRRAFTVCVLILAGVLVLPEIAAEEPKGARAFYNTFTEQEEEAVGRSAADQTDKTLVLLQDSVLEEYLSHVGLKIALASQRPKLKYYFKLVDTPSMNAYSFPGGYIYVNRGLLDFVRTEAELTGVLAHEVGHIVAFHGMNDVARRMLVDRVRQEASKAGLLQEQQAKDILERYGGPVALFVDRKFSREEETEADLLAIYNVQRAGWSPEGFIAFLNRIASYSGNPTFTQMLMRRHPLASDRVELLRAELKEHPPLSGLTLDGVMFRAAKARLKSLPPPRMGYK